MNKKVTVITATYNYGRFIEEAAESVLNQTFQDFEYIIIDDGSTDDTPERMKKYLNKINYIYQENRGQFFQFNKAITMAKGEYIAFLDADDKWHRDFLKELVHFLDNNPAEMVFCDFSSFTDKDIWRESFLNTIPFLKDHTAGRGFIVEKCLEKLIQRDFIFPSTAVVRRSVFDQLKFESTFKGADYDFFIKVAFHYNIGMIAKVLAYKRDHQNNGSSILSHSMTDRIGAMQRLLTNPKLGPQPASLAKKRVADSYYYWAYDEFKKKNYFFAAKLASSSLQASLTWKAFKTWAYSLSLSLFIRKAA